MTTSLVSLSVGIVFAPIAALMAYLITYGEYQHHYSDNKKPRKLAMEAAISTLLLFLALSFIIGFFLKNITS